MKELQQFLNYYLTESTQGFTKLAVDGILGPLTKTASAKTCTLLKKHIIDSGLEFNEDFMFIGIRTDKDIDNTFEDWFVIMYYKARTINAFPASTVSGTPGIRKYWNRMINGTRGVGTITAPQQIDYSVILPGSSAWHNWTGAIGFLYQSFPIDVHRGAYEKEKGLWHYDESNMIRGVLGGFNIHSWRNWFTTAVNNLSEGCQVTKYKYWKILFPVLVKRAQKGVIKYTLLKMF